MNSSSPRIITHLYQDPLTVIWVRCAQRLGFSVARTREMYAGYDGQGTLMIGADDLLDPDDCLAQMIFHELCHALVEGEPGRSQTDWGLDNSRPGNSWREHACLRTQAFISGQYGLEHFMAPTTEYRTEFWSQLDGDPLRSIATSPPRSITASRLAIRRFYDKAWYQPLHDALEHTKALADVLALSTAEAAGDALPASLWDEIQPRPARHPIGFRLHVSPAQDASCATCAWSVTRGPTLRCWRAPRRHLAPTTSACSHFEARETVDCSSCGACCREAYDTVELHPKDAALVRHPHLINSSGGRFRMQRMEGRCQALALPSKDPKGYRCTIYEDRPRTCRDFQHLGPHCLSARQRLGLSL